MRRTPWAGAVAAALVAVAVWVASCSMLRPPPPRPGGPLDAAVNEPSAPSVWGRYAVWADRARGDRFSNVYCYDAATRTVRRLTDDTADRTEPAVGPGGTAVWVERPPGSARVIAFDIPTGRVRVIADAPGNRIAPSTDGRWVVWEDRRTGLAPRVFARSLAGGPEFTVASARGGGQTRPRVGAGFVVWQEQGGFESTAAPAVFGAVLPNGRPRRVSEGTRTALLPETDGRWVVWTQADGGRLVVRGWQQSSGRRITIDADGGEQTAPSVAEDTVWWVRHAGGRLRVYRATVEVTATSLPAPVSPAAPLDQPAVSAGGGSVTWLQRTPAGWRVRGRLSTFTAEAPGIPEFVPASGSPAAFGLAAQEDPPVPPAMPEARVEGTGSVALSWAASPRATAYDVFRSSAPISAADLGGLTPLITTSGTSARVSAAPDEAAHAFTDYYAIAARSGSGTALSENVAPDPHGTFGAPGVPTRTCQVCHFGTGGSDPAARQSCYACHGDTPQTTAFGAGSTFDVQAGFLEDTAAPLPPGGSRHRDAAMSDGRQECVACHTPHRRPWDPDPAASYTDLLRTRPATGSTAWRYNTAASPVGDAFCLDCHGRDATAIMLVGGPTAYTDSGGDHETGWGSSAHGRIPPPQRDPGIACLNCHDQHASVVPKLLGTLDLATRQSLIRGSPVTGDDRSVCYGCHVAASAGWPIPSRDASGFPLTGTWPGRDAYDAPFDTTSNSGGIHGGSTTVWPGTSYAGGACQNCHVMHGPSGAHDILRDTDASGAPGTAVLTPDRFTFCFVCHAEAGPGASVARWYPPSSGGTGTLPDAGHVTRTGGDLPAGSPLPCYDCHNPHGTGSVYGLLVVTQTDASTTIAIGDRSGEITMGSEATSTDVRSFCFTCHTTPDAPAGDPLGWNGSVMASVSPGAKVEGIDRTSGVLRLPQIAAHSSDATVSCYDCHGRDYGDTGGNVHAPLPGSLAGTSAVSPTLGGLQRQAAVLSRVSHAVPRLPPTAPRMPPRRMLR